MDEEMSTDGEWRELDLNNIRAIKVLGKGALGTVFLVYDHSLDPSALSPFALKVVDKSSTPDHNHIHRARWEVSVLSRFKHHPFLPTFFGSFDSPDLFGYAFPFCPGGDLNALRHHHTDRVFSPSVIRFYLAEIVSSLQYLHSLGIVYRDLKPENVLIQHSGHLTLSDFDLSRSLSASPISSSLSVSSQPESDLPNSHRRRFSKKKGPNKAKSARVSPVSRRKPSFSNRERSYSFVGTEEYVAPEVVRGDGHEFAVDWWALGVLSYEMLYGYTPFRGRTRKETFQRILMMQPAFIGKHGALTDLIGKLLEKDPTRRLGYVRGASEIKEHDFFRGLRWDLLAEVVRPPFLPSKDQLELMEGWISDRGMDIRDHFSKTRAPPSPLWSPSPDHYSRDSVSFTDF